MARTPQPRTEIVQAGLDSAELAEASQALANLSASARDIMRNYNLASANPDVLVSEIRAFQGSAVEAMFNVGVRLMVMRQVVPNGEWVSRLASIGMNDRTARRIVQATVKFNDPRKLRSEKLLAIGTSKMLELLVLDDDSIDVLDGGGEVQELDLDDVARMSPTELRDTLREMKADLEAKDTLVQAKDQKINDLDVKLRNAKKFKPSADSEAQTAAEQAQLDEISSAVREVELGMARLAVVVSDVMLNTSNEAVRGRALQGIQYLVKRIHESVTENGLDVDVAMPGRPDWLAD